MGSRARRSRRDFLRGGLALAGLGLLPGCGVSPPAAPTQARVPRIGLLGIVTGRAVEGLKQGLNDFGYGIGARSFEGRILERDDQLPAGAAELVQQDLDVIVAWTPAGTWAAKQATTTIPIVTADGGDPVGNGLVAGLSRPGGNVTGLATHSRDLTGKRLQLLREAVPTMSRPAVLWNPESRDAAISFVDIQAAAQVLGLPLQSLEVRAPGDFNGARQSPITAQSDGLIVIGDFLMRVQKAVVISLAGNARLPAMYDQAYPYIEVGGLMAYGPNVEDLGRRAATYVDKILKGAKPADLPVERPTKVDFVLNLRTARALGLTIPESVLQQATEVIQ